MVRSSEKKGFSRFHVFGLHDKLCKKLIINTL